MLSPSRHLMLLPTVSTVYWSCGHFADVEQQPIPLHCVLISYCLCCCSGNQSAVSIVTSEVEANGDDAACVVSGTAVNNVTIKGCEKKINDASFNKQDRPKNTASATWSNAPPCSEEPTASNSEADSQGRL